MQSFKEFMDGMKFRYILDDSYEKIERNEFQEMLLRGQKDILDKLKEIGIEEKVAVRVLMYVSAYSIWENSNK